MRINLWAYDVESGTERQLTNFEEFDIAYMSAGENDLVFEVGGDLYLMDLSTHDYQAVEINVVSDLAPEMPRNINVGGRISNMTPSPDAKRVVFEARGELFSLPVSDGYTRNLTRSSGAYDKNPAWSPDGRYIAFWSDMSGEYEIYLQDAERREEPRQLTQRGEGYGYTLYWSPDSERIAFIDYMNDIFILEVESGELSLAGNTYWNVGHWGRYRVPCGWSPDQSG